MRVLLSGTSNSLRIAGLKHSFANNPAVPTSISSAVEIVGVTCNASRTIGTLRDVVTQDPLFEIEDQPDPALELYGFILHAANTTVPLHITTWAKEPVAPEDRVTPAEIAALVEQIHATSAV